MLCSVIYRGRFGWEGGRVGARELLFPPFVFSKLRKILTSHLQGAGGQGRVGGGGGGLGSVTIPLALAKYVNFLDLP